MSIAKLPPKRGLTSISKKHGQKNSKKSMWAHTRFNQFWIDPCTYYDIFSSSCEGGFEKWNAWPYFSLFFPWFVHAVSWGKKEIKYEAGISALLSLLPWFVHAVSWGKEEIKYEAGFSALLRLWKNGMRHFFLSSFHDTCTVSRGKKEIKYDAGFYLV